MALKETYKYKMHSVAFAQQFLQFHFFNQKGGAFLRKIGPISHSSQLSSN